MTVRELDFSAYCCWNCVKGRHGICTVDQVPCQCPIPHDGSRRQPAWNINPPGYFDPGPQFEPDEDAC